MPIQSTDTTTTITVANDGDTWTIEAGVTVSTGNQVGVSDSHTENVILNFGSISSSVQDVFLSGEGDVAINGAGGFVSSASTAVELYGTDESYTNIGTTYGDDYAVLMQGSGDTVLNSGQIIGNLAGVVFLETNENAFHNSGSVVSRSDGVMIGGGPGGLVEIDNSGTISGADSIGEFADEQGATHVHNSGVLDGVVDLEYDNAASTIANTGRIIGDVLFGAGSDLYDGRGGSISGVVSGAAGSDTLIGGSGDETLDGGAGRDRLDGGKGGGEDVFRFDAVADSTAKNPDLIARHWGPTDTIDVNALDADTHAKGIQGFTFGGQVADASAALTPHEIQYYQAGGNTYVVADTTGDGKADFEVVIHETFTLTADEFAL